MISLKLNMVEHNDITAVILAAGQGRRLGGPKAFLPYKNHTFLEEIIGQLTLAGLQKVVLVTSFKQHPLIKVTYPGTIEVVINLTPQYGQFSSLRLAIITSCEKTPAAIVVPVDHPCVRASTFAEICSRARDEHMKKIVIPTYHGASGHPTLIPSAVFPAIRNAPADYTLRNIITIYEEKVVLIAVNDPGILRNINTPEAYLDLQHNP